jgi:Predicted membrane protein
MQNRNHTRFSLARSILLLLSLMSCLSFFPCQGQATASVQEGMDSVANRKNEHMNGVGPISGSSGATTTTNRANTDANNAPKVDTLFDLLDVNHDHKLTLTDFIALDKDRDEKITMDEFRGALRGSSIGIIGSSSSSSRQGGLGGGRGRPGSFVKGFTSSTAMIIATEIGDKTFFIAAVLSMRHSRINVFAGAILALVCMTILRYGM